VLANDHYIPRFLTRPWEHDDRKLTYFDFDAKKFDTRSSKRLFAQEGLNTPAVEAMLGKVVESPIGAYLTDVRKNKALLAQINDWETLRAMVLLFAFGTQRLSQVQGVTFPLTLDHFAANPEHIDQLAQLWTKQSRMFGVSLPPKQEMFFPEGGFAITFKSAPPALAIPLGLNHLVVTRDGDLPADEMDEYFANQTVVSMSLSLISKRVVLPPAFLASKDKDETRAKEWLIGERETCAKAIVVV
jgi:Protein of unknown function (DUF4238)